MLQTEPTAGLTLSVEDAFRSFSPRLHGLVQRVVGTGGEVDDVVQEAFVRLEGQAVLGRPSDEVGAWLHRTALNLAFNRLRDTRRWHDRAVRGGLPDAASPGPDEPLHSVLRAEQQAGVRASLDRLPEAQRDCLLLRHSGYTYAEIAAITGMAPGSVGTTLARAERAFRVVHEETSNDLS